jgi:3-methyladenine DNA glycosylase AlkD
MDEAARVAEILAWLKRRGTKRNREGMARYGIVSARVFGVSMETMQELARRLGRDHGLAFVDEPERVTARQMDRWAKQFDNWAICDGICFHLFDKTPHAWDKIEVWAARPEEFVRRAAFALLASLALHDRNAPDARFVESLRLIEAAATDGRNFVKKGVSWALRGIGSRNLVLHSAALVTARELAASTVRPARWIGRDALRDLSRPLVRARIERRRARSKR